MKLDRIEIFCAVARNMSFTKAAEECGVAQSAISMQIKALEDELHDLKVNRRKEVAGKIKEAREQGDLSENAEYDAAKDEQRVSKKSKKF